MNMKLPVAAACALSSLVLAVTRVVAQTKPDDPAPVPGLFLRVTRRALRWDEPAAPARVVGPVYFVGTKGLGSFLITGSAGHVLLYTGMPGSGEMIEKSITKLGFDPKDLKLIL